MPAAGLSFYNKVTFLFANAVTAGTALAANASEKWKTGFIDSGRR
jgi:hypothetical protein